MLLILALRAWGNVEDKGHIAMWWARQCSDPPLQLSNIGFSSVLFQPCGGALLTSSSNLYPLLSEKVGLQPGYYGNDQKAGPVRSLPVNGSKETLLLVLAPSL